MTDGEWVIAFATLAGPIVAIQLQKYLERRSQKLERKLRVFHMLMATRGAQLSADHANALNQIDIVFYGVVSKGSAKRTKTEQTVLDRWHEYHDTLSAAVPTTPDAQQAFFNSRHEQFVTMLEAMAVDLDYHFDRVQLKKGGYWPSIHGEATFAQVDLIKSAADVFSGRKPLKIVQGQPDGQA
ncbi:hypothetical protein A2T82_13920 [Burkholderia cenocepacia]|uniref:DUF6680 family protein n=1 Tax=Burkholderia cenocepacia TaxID=95486 RepID=UPI00078BAAEF|nr:DUF6680 family protein [Burkholderia cenocepacia]AMU07319.1 hypothetical protein A2T82_13920 [Burkholderia cenocepacia]